LIYFVCRAAVRAAGRTEEGALRGQELAQYVVDVLADGQAADVVLLDLTVIEAFTDYFVVATIDNVRQMRALIDALSKELARVAPEVKAQEEGTVESGWMLFDVGELVVHLFSLERRAYYNLEGLWSSAREVVRIQ
jgi:ribosome-associated protein